VGRAGLSGNASSLTDRLCGPVAPGAAAVGLEGVHSALVKINEDLLERKVAAAV
jgi:hypothetical protein